MSEIYENEKTINQLKNLIEMYKPNEKTEYYFVLGYSSLNIGEETLVAQLLANTQNSDVIKFDGLLNINEDDIHTAIENENLQINSHMSLYVEYRIHKMWNDIGKPSKLFIEIGGGITETEIDHIFTPMIQRLKSEGLSKVILLSEASYNGEYIQTKTIQSDVEKLLKRGIEPWLLFVRDSKDMVEITLSKRMDNERIILNKIKDNLNFNLKLLISVPYFEKLDEYSRYIKKRFCPIILPTNKKKILIASKNPSKIADYSLYLGDEYEILTLNDYEYDIDIAEGITSIAENSIAKARTWCGVSGLITIGDDTGFFIHELNGEPGVATRRWGGQLPDNVTNEEFWNYLKEKTKNLKDYTCHFEQNIAIAFPNGEIKLVKNINSGRLNKENLNKEYNGTGYPLGTVFESNNRSKNWDEMSDEEKREFDKELIEELKKKIG